MQLSVTLASTKRIARISLAIPVGLALAQYGTLPTSGESEVIGKEILLASIIMHMHIF